VASTAQIARDKVIPAMMKSAWCDIRAIASRSLDNAREWAAELGIPTAYGSYEELFDDPEIEAIYNPVPNHLHVPITLAAAAKGKHVLCEKPIAMNAAEAEKLKGAPPGVLIAEAFMVRHHPQWIKARELIREGRIGDPRAVQVLLCYRNVEPGNVRNIAEAGGGALYDVGCYAILSGRYVFGAEPARVVALVDRDPNFGTDRLTSVLLDFGEGRQQVLTVGTRSARPSACRSSAPWPGSRSKSPTPRRRAPCASASTTAEISTRRG
jgi:predicted dehydrogenase